MFKYCIVKPLKIKVSLFLQNASEYSNITNPNPVSTLNCTSCSCVEKLDLSLYPDRSWNESSIRCVAYNSTRVAQASEPASLLLSAGCKLKLFASTRHTYLNTFLQKFSRKTKYEIFPNASSLNLAIFKD